jgi:hypothetical protein
MLEGAPSLMAVTLLEELQRRHPEQFGDSVLRTLQRRVGSGARSMATSARSTSRRNTRPAAWGCRTSR